MKEVFADADYWVARVNPMDDLHGKAVAATRRVADSVGPDGVRIVTTDGALAEALLQVSHGGVQLHRAMARFVAGLIDGRDAGRPIVLFSTEARMQRGLQFYEDNIGQMASLHDGISLAIVTERDIRDVLTRDPAFLEVGCRCLLRDD